MMTTRVPEITRSVRESNFYELLRSGATMEHFAARRPKTTREHQVNYSTNQVTHSSCRNETSDLQPDLARSDVDHIFWVFPRELTAAASGEQIQEDEDEDDDCFSAKPRQRWLSYQFQKLSDRPEWLVVVSDSTTIESTYLATTTSGIDELPIAIYRHEARNSSWDWVSPENLGCSVNEGQGSGISVVCPYVAYKDLCQITGFRWGFTYADFVQQLGSSRRVGHMSRILEIKKAMCKEWSVDMSKEQPMIIFDETCEMTQSGTPKDNGKRYDQRDLIGDDETEGFFNNIPGRGVWIHHKDLVPGVNLVSSQWVDWKAFVVNDSQLTTAYPKLRSANGELIKCRGYISGNWIPGNLEGRYVMEKVFVVDAVFTTSKEPRTQREFAFCQSTFTENSRADCKPCVLSSRWRSG
ncbi:hypothetical protein F4860DRAFT_238895 [Xylaria cubensis]|nr:hypothetical protein F4860DRAFT_238895 [Xylaria cubensis]